MVLHQRDDPGIGPEFLDCNTWLRDLHRSDVGIEQATLDLTEERATRAADDLQVHFGTSASPSGKYCGDPRAGKPLADADTSKRPGGGMSFDSTLATTNMLIGRAFPGL